MKGTVKGTVKFYNETKGYGFIGVDGRGDVFVHFSAIKNAPSGEKKRLVQGQRVEFEIEHVDGKERAARVMVLA